MGMGWYPGMMVYGGMWGYNPYRYAWMPGFNINIGGHPYYGWSCYHTYYNSNPGWVRSRVVNNTNYNTAPRGSGSYRYTGSTGSYRSGQLAASFSRPSGSFNSGRFREWQFFRRDGFHRPGFSGGSSGGSAFGGSRPSGGFGGSGSLTAAVVLPVPSAVPRRLRLRRAAPLAAEAVVSPRSRVRAAAVRSAVGAARVRSVPTAHRAGSFGGGSFGGGGRSSGSFGGGRRR